MKYDRETVKEWAGESQWRACRADLARFRVQGYSGLGSEGFWALVIFRLQKVILMRRPRWLWAPVRIALNVVRKVVKMITNIELDAGAKIGAGLLIPHRGPIHVHGEAKIGVDCCIFHGCTIGGGGRPGAPTIGDHVLVGCQSTIIGPVTVGDGATIAANSLVISDVPALHTAIGVPARMHAPVIADKKPPPVGVSSFVGATVPPSNRRT